MLQLLTTLDWKLIISLVTLALVIFGILWGNNLLGRREKLKIKTGGLNHRVGERAQHKVAIFKLYTTELQRTGEKDIRYLTQILLKLDEHLYNELNEYIDFRDEKQLILAEGSKPFPKDVIVSIGNWNDYEYKIRDIQAWNSARKQIANKISQATFEVGLVWQDKRKPQWKKITKENYDKWVEL